MALLIEEGGLFTTVQDLGRKGYLHQGVVESGAMDRTAARNANIAVGNEEHAAVLEMTFIGPTITFQAGCLICIAGDGMTPYMNGNPSTLGTPFFVPQGTSLSFKVKKKGIRTYLAVAGGIDVPVTMESRSTYLRAGLGGFNGRKLEKGDQLTIGEANELVRPIMEEATKQNRLWEAEWRVFSPIIEEQSDDRSVIRAIRGNHYHRLTDESKKKLFQATFTIKSQSDRMGYRLESEEAIQLEESFSLLSEAVALGTVQAPPDGQLIILMADRQTTGGYPRALQTVAVDVSKLAQLRPGDSFTFTEVSLEEAEQLYLEHERAMAMRRNGILLKWKQIRRKLEGKE